jgi:hypothetical protein
MGKVKIRVPQLIKNNLLGIKPPKSPPPAGVLSFLHRIPARLARPPHSTWLEGGPEPARHLPEACPLAEASRGRRAKPMADGRLAMEGRR